MTDVSVFMRLARHYETEFHQDMQLLNVRPADVLTRVSEYVPEIVTFIQEIIAKGHAYKGCDGSVSSTCCRQYTLGARIQVYFDTVHFDSCPHHHYAKLVPEAYTDTDAMQAAMREGEGELTCAAQVAGAKRNETDFALWKAAKPGEPKWPSPWGEVCVCSCTSISCVRCRVDLAGILNAR